MSQVFLLTGNKAELKLDLNLQAYYILKSKEGRFWFSSEQGLFSYSEGEEEITEHHFPGYSDNVAVFCLYESKDKIWVGTRDEGLFECSKMSGEIKKFNYKFPFIKSIYEDEKDNLLIGDIEGLKIFINNSSEIYSYQPAGDTKESISATSVDAIYEDIQGNLWFGLRFGGVNLAYFDKGFRYLDYPTKDPNVGKTIISMASNGSNYVWVGAYTNGLEKIDIKNKTAVFYQCNVPGSGVRCGSTYELFFEDETTLWIGSYFGGLQRCDMNTGKFTYYVNDPRNPNSLSGNDVRSIAMDRDKNMWIVSHGYGLNKWNRRENTFTRYQHSHADSGSLANDWAFHVICDSRNYIWVATPGGLSVMRNNRNFYTYKHNPDDTTSICSDEVFTVFEDSKGQIWAGTREGLCKLVLSENHFLRYTVNEGLIDNYVCSILEDGSGNLWISGKMGITKLNPLTGYAESYAKGDGLQDNEFAENSCLKTQDGYLFFGGMNRGTWFHPDSIKRNTTPPRVYISNLKFFNRPVGIDGETLNKSIRYTDEIVLSYKQKVITIEYVALNFIHPENNKYAYKLENFDKGWNEVEGKREATYTNLAPGKYTFRVKASNNDNYWNETGASLKIVIRPPFWGTLWFRLFASFIALILVSVIFYIREKQNKLRNLKLEKMVETRTIELQKKNRILSQKTRELNASNLLLEERQEQIMQQTEELQAKNEQLFEASEELREQKEILEQTNIKLTELNAMKDKFFSIIGHDLKNPINVIKGFSELLTQDYEQLDNDKRKYYLKHIDRTIDKTHNLLEDLLSWAQTQNGRLETYPVSINMHQMISKNIILFNQQALEKNVKLNALLENNSIVCYADQHMVDTILRNLISNALKFTREGEVTIKCSDHSDSNYMLVSVKDTGVGIEESEIDKLFRIDMSISSSGTSGETGTGLGLILCKEFVEKNGGKIWLESTYGVGTEFFFTLPRTEGVYKG